MVINYKKELETAAKNMIMVHEPDLLIKMVARTIVQKIRVNHAGILLHDQEKKTYVLTVSSGSMGIKIPAGFARMDSDNELIKFFKERHSNTYLKDGTFLYSEGKEILSANNLSPEEHELMTKALYQMEIFDTVACIPTYFRNDLLGIILLGAKKNSEKFAQDELDFLVALSSDVAMAIKNAQLFKDLALELERKHKLFLNITLAFAAAVDAKDHYTHGHINRVTDLCLKIADRLSSENNELFNDSFIENLHVASLLHDIGKIGVPENILNKNGPLDEEERKKINEHPMIGVNILQSIKELDTAILGVKYHHERYDGNGYPEKLRGEEIPLIAAIISVADAYDAMTTDRPYRKGLPKETAINEIKTQRGRQFAPLVADTFISLYEDKRI